jgi:spermidine/putrescine transport system permease protein
MVEQKSILVRVVHPLIVYLAYMFLYVPVFIIAMFSFNKSRFSVAWEGFSLEWYGKLFSSPEILDALYVSLIVAVSATFLSVLIGTSLVVASKKWNQVLSYALFYPNLVIPEIALAIGVLSVFSFFKIHLGYGSLIAGHTLIGLGFVVPIVRARFVELDPFLTEASLDLGATSFQTFRKILVPLLRPSLFAAGLIVFTLSLDDFLIAFFCASPKIQTLSLYVYSQMKETVDPSINAISILLLALSSIVAIVLCSMKVIDKVLHYE